MPGNTRGINTIEELARHGQSLWLDNLLRDMIEAASTPRRQREPSTVNTLPNATLSAFQNHGRVRPSLEAHVDEARDHLGRLADVGIDLDEVTRELEVEGVEAFVKSYDRLRDGIADVVGGFGPEPLEPEGRTLRSDPVLLHGIGTFEMRHAHGRWERDGST